MLLDVAVEQDSQKPSPDLGTEAIKQARPGSNHSYAPHYHSS